MDGWVRDEGQGEEGKNERLGVEGEEGKKKNICEI